MVTGTSRSNKNLERRYREIGVLAGRGARGQVGDGGGGGGRGAGRQRGGEESDWGGGVKLTLGT